MITVGFIVALVAVHLLMDYYVYRNWRRFAAPRFRWTLPVYVAIALVMITAMVSYALLSNWWDVEPRLLRRIVVGAWAVWYLPKLPIVIVLVVKDLARATIWLFEWFKVRFGRERPDEPPPDLADLPHMSRAEFLRKVGWTAAGVPFAVVGYGVFKGLYDFQIRHVTVPIEGLPQALDGIRIAQISDLHAGSLFSERPMEDVVSLVAGERPDLIAITGDFVNSDHRELPTILSALERMRAPLGVFGVRGNHDHYAHVGRVSELIRATGAELLVNDARTLRIDGARLHILGTDNTGFRQTFGDLPRTLAATDRNGEDAFILLAHDPSFWDSHVREIGPEIDLTLSGHTHGGQMGFEFGPIRWSMARMVYPRWAGLYDEAGVEKRQQLYVNRGIATVGPPVRLGVPPEITILTLTRSNMRSAEARTFGEG